MLTFLPLGKKKRAQASTKPHKSQNPTRIFSSRKSSFLICFLPTASQGAHHPPERQEELFVISGGERPRGVAHSPRGRAALRWDPFPATGTRPLQQRGRASRGRAGSGPALLAPRASHPAAPARPSPHGRLLKTPASPRCPRPGPAGGDTAASHRHPTPRSRPPAPLPTRGGANPPRIREGKKHPKPQGPGEAFAHPRGGGEQPPASALAPPGGDEGDPPPTLLTRSAARSMPSRLRAAQSRAMALRRGGAGADEPSAAPG